MEPLLIKRKKTQLYRNLAFLPVSIFVVYTWYHSAADDGGWRWTVFAFLCFLALGGLIRVISDGYHILKKTPAMIIDQEGITDFTFDTDGDKITWKHISHAELKKSSSINYLLIHLYDPEVLLSIYQGARLGKLKGLQKRLGTPWAINTAQIDCQPYDLINIIEEKTGNKVEPL